MQIKKSVSLADYTTIRLGGKARFLIDISSVDELTNAITTAKSQNTPIFILGGGSNVVASDVGFNGLIIRLRIPGFDIIEDNPSFCLIKVGAGENWDVFVKKTVDRNLSGVEALSGIPGTVGATPVQNVGAYGQEVADTIVSVDVYDIENSSLKTIPAEKCMFKYRDSIFRSTQKGKYVITYVTFKLFKSPPQPPFYEALEKYFSDHSITSFTNQSVRDAVIAIRSDKLPDPNVKPNCGSFFKNVIVDDWKVNELKQTYPDMPTYDMGDRTFKIPTGWLIEQTGLRGQLINGIRVNEKNALVLINESAKNYVDLAEARDKIISSVRDKFGLHIEQEPIEIPAS